MTYPSTTTPTITHGYATLDEFKSRYLSTDATEYVTDLTRDFDICSVITSVSRLIDAICHRNFWYFSNIPEIRYFSPQSADMCMIDDLWDITTLETDDDRDGIYENTWDITDYWLSPINTTGCYTFLKRTPYAQNVFSVLDNNVKLTGIYGYSADGNTPELVHEACMIQSNRIWMRKGAPFGVVGSAEMGQIVIPGKLDPDMILMLKPLMRSLV